MSNIDDYKIGMTVYGEITGIRPYGAFVSFKDGVTGLIHISEISHGFVKDVNNYVKVKDHVMLKVIDIDKNNKQLRLSYKALNSNSRKRIKKVKYKGLPDNQIGFSSLATNLPIWVKEREK